MGVYDDLTIEELKRRIDNKTNISPSQQLLLYKKQTLWHENRTLRQYRVHDGAVICLRVYNEDKIKKLQQQYIFTKSIDKAYKGLETEISTMTEMSETDLRSEIDPKRLYEMAFQEEIEWENLDQWMYTKLKTYLYDIQERSIKEKSKTISTTQHTVHWESVNSKSNKSAPSKSSRLKPINSMKTIEEELKENNNNKRHQSVGSNNINIINNHVEININNRNLHRGRHKKRKRRRRRDKEYEINYENNNNSTTTIDHQYKQFIYRDHMFCCHDGYIINVSRYIIIMSILFVILSISSFFVYFEHLKLSDLSTNYYTASSCNVYNESYAVWIAYNEYNGHGNECYKKNRNELQVDRFWGDIQFPTNTNTMSTNINISTTIIIVQYECFVTKDCNEIIITTQGKSSLDNPYRWDSTVVYVVTIFMWICSIICVLCALYLYFGRKITKKKYFKTQWNDTPPNFKCIYFIKYNQRKYKFNEKIPSKVIHLIYKYYHKEMEPSKSSKSMPSTNIVYYLDLDKGYDTSTNRDSIDKTASSRDKSAESRESKSL